MKFIAPLLGFLTIFIGVPISAEPENVLRVGVTLPLTGSLGHIGEDIRRGMALAQELTLFMKLTRFSKSSSDG